MDDPFYKSAKWTKKRERILRRDGYMCQYFKRYGKSRPANTVHHVFPREIYPEYEWEDWNMISLSDEAHNLMHDRINHDLTPIGAELLRRTARARGFSDQEVWNKYLRSVKEKARRQCLITLVMGLPGTAKSEYARELLGSEGLCYDLDCIASALRMNTDDDSDSAKKLAAEFYPVFIEKVRTCTKNVVVVMAAPTVPELEQIDPDVIVWRKVRQADEFIPDEAVLRRRIQNAIDWGKENGRTIVEE